MKYVYILCFLVVLLYAVATVSGRRKLVKKPRPTAKPKRPKPTDDPSSLPDEDGHGISSVRREGCSAPEVLVNGSSLLGTGVRGDGRNDFATVHEVQFLGILGPEEQKRICKIRCLDGVWVGPFCNVDDIADRFQKVLKRCTVRLTDAEVIGRTTDGKVLPVDTEMSMPHGSEIHFTCVEPGMYKFDGNATIQCDDGEWTSDLPNCEATTMQRNFSLDAPPTILYHVASGDAGLTESGSVVVFPGSIINFDCLFQRQFGNPEWSWTPTHRQYPSAWALSPEEKSWKYRLSVYYAKNHDSGVFTCITPHGESNDITMEVKDVHCPALQSVDHNRVMAVEGNKMHSKARFACMEGYILVGPEEITCQASGQWSEEAPHCEIIHCPKLAPDSIHLHVSTRNKSYGTRVYFSCPMGFKLVGPPHSNCQKTGNWSEKLPTCKPITCKPPMTPLNGRVLDTGRYLSGDFVQYTCNAGHVLVGESVSICNDHGVWTQPPPLCKPACEFPGEPSNGFVRPTKFHYDIGEVVVVGCDSGFRLLGFQNLRCTSSSHWSSPLPHCRPYLATR